MVLAHYQCFLPVYLVRPVNAYLWAEPNSFLIFKQFNQPTLTCKSLTTMTWSMCTFFSFWIMSKKGGRKICEIKSLSNLPALKLLCQGGLMLAKLLVSWIIACWCTAPSWIKAGWSTHISLLSLTSSSVNGGIGWELGSRGMGGVLSTGTASSRSTGRGWIQLRSIISCCPLWLHTPEVHVLDISVHCQHQHQDWESLNVGGEVKSVPNSKPFTKYRSN